MNVREQKLVDQLAEENRQQREIIRELIRERVDSDRHWAELVLKVVEQQAKEV